MEDIVLIYGDVSDSVILHIDDMLFSTDDIIAIRYDYIQTDVYLN